MSTDTIKGRIVFTCDACDDTLEPDTDDWSEANEDRREAGWRALFQHGTWVHYCSEC